MIKDYVKNVEFPKFDFAKTKNVPGGIWTRDPSHLIPLLNQVSYQGWL